MNISLILATYSRPAAGILSPVEIACMPLNDERHDAVRLQLEQFRAHAEQNAREQQFASGWFLTGEENSLARAYAV
ncbi:MAG: hypothetical protein ACLP8S_22415 [Solirubrobacteraceae bacterium]